MNKLDEPSSGEDELLQQVIRLEQSPIPRLLALQFLTTRLRVLFVVKDIEGAEVAALLLAYAFAFAYTWPNKITLAPPISDALTAAWSRNAWLWVLWGMALFKTGAIVSGNVQARRWAWVLATAKWCAVVYAIYITLGIALATLFIVVAIIMCIWTLARLTLNVPRAQLLSRGRHGG